MPVGGSLPVPMNGILRSAHTLHTVHLREVVHEGIFLVAGVPVALAWEGCEQALRAYVVAAMRELEVRGDDYPSEDWVRFVVGDDLPSGARVLKGRVPSVRAHYRDPSWISDPARCARHRAVLLGDPDPAVREWYHALGWREQISLFPNDLTLPPHDPSVGMPRWFLDTSRDW